MGDEISWYKSLRIEMLVFLGAVFFGALDSYRSKLGEPAIFGLCLALAIVPILSDFANEHYFQLGANQHYRHFLKTLVLVPFLLNYSTQYPKLLSTTVVSASVVLAIIFLWHTFVLGEVNPHNGRALPNIRQADPNFVCVLLGFSFLLMLSLRVQRVAKVLMGGLLLACCLITESRMGLASLGLGILVLGHLHFQKLKLTLGIFLFVFLSFWLLGERFINPFDESAFSRLDGVAMAWELFLANPYFGVGFDQSSEYYYELVGYPKFQSLSNPLTVHNVPMQVLAELGFVGFVVYGLFAFFLLSRLIRAANANLTVAAGFLFLNALTLPIAYHDFVWFFAASLIALSKPFQAPENVPVERPFAAKIQRVGI